ncbi:MAG TPA: primosomal protein N' [Gemmatimonadales bacterium]|jgi:primosomal protein N' (replication factor Y)|nr:primosomal protein N' [Gemmatimonadales bacterium]
MTEQLAQVALPLPVFAPYTYTIPETLADRVVPGARVVVPVRKRELVGIVVATGVERPAVEARPLLAAPDAEPALPPALLRTAEWMAGYYGAPIGIALKAMLPAPMWGASRVLIRLTGGAAARLGGLAEQLVEWLDGRGGEAPLDTAARHFRKPLWEVADRLARVGAAELVVEPAEAEPGSLVERRLELAGERLTLIERGAKFKRRVKQRALYETLEQLGGSAPIKHLKETLGMSDAVIRALADSGLARVVKAERLRDPFEGERGTPPPEELTGEQAAVLEQIEGLAPGSGALLFGVTGSGKTLVYLRAVRRAVEAGRGAIVLVPEIGLTPQMVSRVRGMFGKIVAVLHSGLSDGERSDAWRLLRRGERRVAVGARSAMFAPVKDLGLIVVDEEHETSYKNGEAPRYHAREVALVRARLEGARYVLGSATPSLETFTLTRTVASPSTVPSVLASLRLCVLPKRIDDRPLPPVEIVDMRSAPSVKTGHSVPWSEALDSALTAAMARGDQAILLLNRRGYAAFVQCPACGLVPECPDCSIALTLHRVPPGLRCHYCGRRFPVPVECANCGHVVQRAHGIGTQQLEELVAARFPKARLARMDLDTTSTRWSHHRILDRIGRGDVDILLGTQMIAKGMDFPNVTLVGVVDADTALHLPDFRAGERTYQLLAQVAGRAGRGPKGGKVLVQTRNPEHPALKFAARHDTEGFLAQEAEARKSPPYPPETSLLNVVVSAEQEKRATDEAVGVAAWLEKLISAQGLPLILLGPAPCPLTRIKARWRWHVLVKGPVEEIGRVVRYAAPRLEGQGTARVVLDRDPVSLL